LEPTDPPRGRRVPREFTPIRLRAAHRPGVQTWMRRTGWDASSVVNTLIERGLESPPILLEAAALDRRRALAERLAAAMTQEDPTSDEEAEASTLALALTR